MDAAQAEAIIGAGDADMIAIARAALDDPNWGHHAAAALGQPEQWPKQYERAAASVWAGA